MTEQFSIRDVAELIANVQHIKLTVDAIKEEVNGINGRLRDTETNVAVLEKGAEEHEKQHKKDHVIQEKDYDKLDGRIKAVGIGNAGFALVGAFFATLLGRQT